VEIMKYLAIVICLMVCLPALGAMEYEVVLLQQVETSNAMAVNDQGVAVGYDTVFNSALGTYTYRPLRWSRDGVRTQLATSGRAIDINNKGEALVDRGQQNLYSYPLIGAERFLIDYGNLTIPPASGSFSDAENGVVTPVNSGPVYWRGGTGGGVVNLSTTIGFFPQGILPSGLMYGKQKGTLLPAMATESGVERAYPLPAGYTQGVAIAGNDSGDIIGEAITPGGAVDYFFSNAAGDYFEFAPPQSGYNDLKPSWINSGGVVVGSATSTTGGPLLPYMLRNGQLQDINDLVPASWQIYSPSFISDGGYILATGGSRGGSTVAPVLLRPIPEPSVGAIVLGAIAIRASVARRGRERSPGR
jgi:hypothetical protein